MKLASMTLLVVLSAGNTFAQTSTRAPEPIDTTAEDGRVNPMTGKLLSEERLARQLGSEKLTTSIIQEQVKQAELKNQLGLASSRRAVEEARLRSESANLGSSTRRNGVVPPRESLTNREKTMAAKDTAPAAPTPAAPTLPPPPAAPAASGSLKIGDDTLTVTARYNGPDARITYVDAQPRPGQSPAATPLAAPAAGASFVPAVSGPVGGTPIQLLPNYNR